MPNLNNSNAIVTRLSSNATLATSLRRLSDKLVDMAIAEVDPELTETERIAQAHIRAFQLTKGIDLAGLIARHDILMRILEGNMIIAANIEGIQSEADLARAVNITPTRLSREKDIVTVVIPWVQQNLGIDVATWWESVDMASIGEVLPVLKVLITGNRSSSRSANATAEQLLHNHMLDIAANNPGLEPEEVHRRAQVSAGRFLLEDQATLPVREIRRSIRQNTDRDVLQGYLLEGLNGRRAVLISMTDEQYERTFSPTLINTGRLEMNTIDRDDRFWDSIRALVG